MNDDDIIEIDRSRPSFGSWDTEDESAAEFDHRIESSGLFERVFKEVRGYYLTYRPGREDKGARIDRVLLPSKKLRDAGWSRVIGIELKRSGEKLGRPLAQAIDYTYCAWNVGHYWMLCENVFLWPFGKQHRAIESVMVHNSVGVIYEQPSASLVFQLERQVIRANRDGSVTAIEPAAGRKVGSR